MLPINPAQIPTLYKQAMSHAAAGRVDQARAELQRLAQAAPQTAELHFGLGQVEMKAGNADAAFGHLQSALRLRPAEAAIWQAALRAAAKLTTDRKRAAHDLRALAKSAKLGGPAVKQIDDALRQLEASANPDPVTTIQQALTADDPQAPATAIHDLDTGTLSPDYRVRILRLLTDAQQIEAAELFLDRCEKTMRTTPASIRDRAWLRRVQGRDDEAQALYAKAVARFPKDARALGEQGVHLQKLGRIAEAEPLLREAIRRDPSDGTPFYILALARKLPLEDPLVAEMTAKFEVASRDDPSKAALGFALAKIHEDNKRYDQVFTYLRPANEAVKARQPYSVEARQRDIDAIKAAFAGDDFAAPKAETTEYAPIFVTGLPRSGTTLVESILAAHSRVTGGGELGIARETVTRHILDGGQIRALSDIPDAEIAAMGFEAAARMQRVFPGADILTDKSVQSYMLMGPILAAMPKARMVLVQRDPRDTLLSIYRNYFELGLHRYAYDLRDLGRYYRAYLDITAFWKAKLGDRVIEIGYEDLTADPEPESRALIAACGLDWEDACLSFHESARRVDTLSLAQVRQPIYTSSRRAWQRYEHELAELFEALGDALPKE